jgi:hypothetical protein
LIWIKFGRLGAPERPIVAPQVLTRSRNEKAGGLSATGFLMLAFWPG